MLVKNSFLYSNGHTGLKNYMCFFFIFSTFSVFPNISTMRLTFNTVLLYKY